MSENSPDILGVDQTSISSAEASRARTSAPRVKARGSKVRGPASGTNTSASRRNSDRRGSSLKTSPPVSGVGCPMCGETCTCWDTERVPSNYLPSTSERPTNAKECSCLLPTPSASSYGSNKGGAAGRVGKETSMARKGLLPTPTVKGNYNKAGLSARSGDGLGTAVGPGPLNPVFAELMMGFPADWTSIQSS